MPPFLIENDLLGITLLSLTLAFNFGSLLGIFVGVLQTQVIEVICQRIRVLIVRKVFMSLVEMLRLHSNVICSYILMNYNL